MKNKEKIWVRELQVGWDETDLSGKLSLTGLSLVLQRAAVEHAEHLGFGYSEISKDNVSWVLFRLNIHILRRPAWKETIRITTWPSKVSKLSAFREFILHDAQGKVICTALSEWLVIDLTTRRPQRMDRFNKDEYLTPEKTGFSYEIPRLNTRCEFEDLFSVTTRHSDIDLNGHTNARKYFDWLADAVFHGDATDKEVSFVQMNYFNECRLGEGITIQRCPEDGKTFRGLKKASGKTAFIARVEF